MWAVLPRLVWNGRHCLAGVRWSAQAGLQAGYGPDDHCSMGSRSWRAVVAAPLIAVVVAAGCGGGAPGSKEPAAAVSTTSSDTTTTTRMRVCVAGDLDPRQLAPSIVEEVTGFAMQPDDVGDTGPVDLAKAIRDDGETDAERVMHENGFRAGYQRLWLNDAGEELIVFVYEFCKEDGVARHARRIVDIFEGRGLAIQPLVGPTVGTGFTLAGSSTNGLWLWAIADTTLVMVATFGNQRTDATTLLERADGLLVAQLDRLTVSRDDLV